MFLFRILKTSMGQYGSQHEGIALRTMNHLLSSFVGGSVQHSCPECSTNHDHLRLFHHLVKTQAGSGSPIEPPGIEANKQGGSVKRPARTSEWNSLQL